MDESGQSYCVDTERRWYMDYKYIEKLTDKTPDRRIARIACILTKRHKKYRNYMLYRDIRSYVVNRITTLASSIHCDASVLNKVQKDTEEYNKLLDRQLSSYGDIVSYTNRVINTHLDTVCKVVGFDIEIRDTYNMLKALIKDKGEVQWGYAPSYGGVGGTYALCVKTKPIVLEDTNKNQWKLGPMLMCYNITIDAAYATNIQMAIKPIEANWSQHGSYFHPHVVDGKLCTGDGGVACAEAMLRSDVYTLFEVTESILGQYNPESPYKPLEEWDTGDNCVSCGCTVNTDESYNCDYCDQGPFCSECATYCESCDREVCRDCAEGDRCCTNCGRWVCGICIEDNEEVFTCSECGETWCGYCQDKLAVCSSCDTVCCPECSKHCSECGGTICALCMEDGGECITCGSVLCGECVHECDICGEVACNLHIHECSECGNDVCEGCMERCSECDTILCKKCIEGGMEDADGVLMCPSCRDSADSESDDKGISEDSERLVDNEQEQEQEQEQQQGEDRVPTGTEDSGSSDRGTEGEGGGSGGGEE